MESRCGHVRLNVQYVSPDDYRAARVPAEETCASCRAESNSREEPRMIITHRARVIMKAALHCR